MDDWHTISPDAREQVPTQLFEPSINSTPATSSIDQSEQSFASPVSADTGKIVLGALSGMGKAPPPVISQKIRRQSMHLAAVRPKKPAFDLRMAVISARRYDMNLRMPAIPVKKYLLNWRVAVVALCVLLVGSAGVVFALNSSRPARPAAVVYPALSATVAITPDSKALQDTFTISAVTDTPNQTQYQVQARMITGTGRLSETVNATGQSTTPAVSAAGTVTFTNLSSTGALNIQAGTLLTDNVSHQGFGIVIDQAVSIGTAITVNGIAQNPAQTVNAYAAVPGAAGDINAAGFGDQIFACTALNPICWSATNLTPFTGGVDAQNFSIVQQSDIDGAAGRLQAQIPSPAQALQGQLHTNEQLSSTTSHCNSVTGSNHNAGDKTATVTVTIRYTCNGEAYNQGAAISAAKQELKDQAATNPGQNYALQGNTSATIKDVQVPDNNNTINMTITASGTWVFQFTDAMKQSMAKQIADKPAKAIPGLLKGEMGLKSVAVMQLIGGDHITLPADPQKITIMVQTTMGQ